MSIIDLVQKDPGYSLDLSISRHELLSIKQFISEQWQNRITSVYPHLSPYFQDETRSIEDYDFISHKIDHKETWPKSSRILDNTFEHWFRESGLRQKLEKEFVRFVVSDEECLGRPNFYWRICRPQASDDVGPLHRDSWFWNCQSNYSTSEETFTRTKVWLPICIQPGLCGLQVEPHSHKRTDINWTRELRDGKVKPQIITTELDLKPVILFTPPGQMVVFNDDLIHGGAINKGTRSRVSLEFTMLLANK